MNHSYEENSALTFKIKQILEAKDPKRKKIRQLKKLSSEATTPLAQSHAAYYEEQLQASLRQTRRKTIFSVIMLLIALLYTYRILVFYNPEYDFLTPPRLNSAASETSPAAKNPDKDTVDSKPDPGTLAYFYDSFFSDENGVRFNSDAGYIILYPNYVICNYGHTDNQYSYSLVNDTMFKIFSDPEVYVRLVDYFTIRDNYNTEYTRQDIDPAFMPDSNAPGKETESDNTDSISETAENQEKPNNNLNFFGQEITATGSFYHHFFDDEEGIRFENPNDTSYIVLYPDCVIRNYGYGEKRYDYQILSETKVRVYDKTEEYLYLIDFNTLMDNYTSQFIRHSAGTPK